MTRRIPAASLLVAFATAGCDWSPALSSDPAFWAPAMSAATSSADATVGFDAGSHGAPDAGRHGASDAGSDGASDAGSHVKPSCTDTPEYDPTLSTSKAGAFSHSAGQPCLEGCHESGGSARLAFAAGGTVHKSQTSHEVAKSGFVYNVGRTTLAVDACGNVYATAEALKAGPQSSQPYVRNPAFHLMDKSLASQKDPGSCNQSGCHDFGTKLRWGIYF